MINSQQVSAMIAAQQQQFAAAMDYSYQTSMGYAGNIGTYGFGANPMMPPPPMPGRTINPRPYTGANTPGFSYDQHVDYGISNAAGSRAMGTVTSAASLASTMINLGGMYKGFSAARAAGGGLAGSALSGAFAFSPMMAAGMGLEYAVGNMHAGAQEQQGVYAALGSQNFINSASRTGRGFGRQESKAISDFTREMQSVPEAMTSMSELTRIMGTISQMGMMHGARSAQEFSRRFKENINTLKELSKVIQGSMEEAIKYMGEAKQAGFYSQQGIKANTAQRIFTSGVTGLSPDQLHQLQMSGSAMSFGTGGFRRSGANSILRTARQVGVANEMGILSNEQLQEMTGVEGPEAIAALSENLAGAAHRMSRSGLGTAMSIAVAAQDKQGHFTGGIDEDIASKIRGGGISKQELLGLARKKTSSRGSKISFSRQRDRIRSEMASSVGVEGIAMELGEILGERGWDNPEVLNLVMQRYGVDEKTAAAVQKIGSNLGNIQSEIGIKGQTEARRMAEQSYMSSHFTGDAIKRKFTKKLENTFSEPFKKMGADMSHAVETYVDEFMDSLMGRYSVEITKGTSDMVAGAFTGNKTSQQAIADMSRGMKQSTNYMTAKHSYGQGLLDMMGTRTSNQDRYDFLSDLPDKFKTASGGPFDYTLSQSSGQESAFRNTLEKAQQGMFRKEVVKAYDDLGESGNTTARGFRSFLYKNNAKLSEMSQLEKLNYIKSEGSEYLYRLQQSGASPEEAIALLQRKSGTGNLVGAFNASEYNGERYGTGTFSSAQSLAENQRDASNKLADAFGDKGSAVSALLGKDSKDRDLFLKAASGDPEANRLLNEHMSPTERDPLLKKFGVSEESISSLRGIYGGAGGQDVSQLAKSAMIAINQSSIAGEATQLRRQGLDIGDRFRRSALGSKGQSILDFSNKLSGIDSTEKLAGALGPGGTLTGGVHDVLNLVRGLKGTEREQALDVLGPGARGAISMEQSVARALRTRGGVAKIRAEGDDSVKEFIDQRHGKLSAKDRIELAQKLGDRSFASSLAAGGRVQGNDIDNQKQLAQELTKFAEANTKFAQIVFEGNPSLKGAQGAHDNVQGSGNNIIQRAKKLFKGGKG